MKRLVALAEENREMDSILHSMLLQKLRGI